LRAKAGGVSPHFLRWRVEARHVTLIERCGVRHGGVGMATIREIMTPQPIAVRPDSAVKEAVELLIEHGISGLPVVDAELRIVGVLSEKDLLRLFSDPEVATVGAVMTRVPMTIDVEAPLVEVVDCLMAYDFRRVLIHERGRLVGVVSRADLMPAILSTLTDRTS
jgi:CBS domain-containing protein